MTQDYPKTDEEKIKLIKDLMQRALAQIEEDFLIKMDELEKDWLDKKRETE